jgi:probable rRNA maturation factor
VSVFLSDEQDEPVDATGLRRFAAQVLEAEAVPSDGEMAVVLVSPEQMGEYHRTFMGREGPTDVLAFPLEDLEPGRLPPRLADEPPLSLGDVFLCPAEIRRHAAAEEVSFEDYVYLLLAHGILHLLGYDHADETGTGLMEEREQQLLAMIGREVP